MERKAHWENGADFDFSKPNTFEFHNVLHILWNKIFWISPLNLFKRQKETNYSFEGLKTILREF